MPKHIYDKDGNYNGKILSDEEHRKKRGSGEPMSKKCKGCENIFWYKKFKFMADNLGQQIYEGSWYMYCDKCLPHWYYSSKFFLMWIMLYFPIGLYGLYYRIVNSDQIIKWRKNNKVEKITVHTISILDTIIMVFKSANKFRLRHLLTQSKRK